jgi:thiamine biosynthesis lipoprotein
MYNIIMKKFLPISITMALLLCSCAAEKSDTRFLLNTVCTITAECDMETVNGAFALCEDYENLLSKTKKNSQVYKLNNGETVTADDELISLIEKAIYYSQKTNGNYDITVCPVSDLWDFNNQIVPSKDEIAEALKSVDYQSIKIDGKTVNLNGSKIDLGSIAKGYIADRAVDYLKSQNVKSGIVNLGGNVKVFGKEYTVGIQRPFSNDIMLTVKIKNASAVTSGIYQRAFEKDGKFYHHILDTKTGYPLENTLTSVTILGENSAECDVLSTVCLILGEKDGMKLINETENYEAVFITKNENVLLSDGLKQKGKEIIYK